MHRRIFSRQLDIFIWGLLLCSVSVQRPLRADQVTPMAPAAVQACSRAPDAICAPQCFSPGNEGCRAEAARYCVDTKTAACLKPAMEYCVASQDSVCFHPAALACIAAPGAACRITAATLCLTNHDGACMSAAQSVCVDAARGYLPEADKQTLFTDRSLCRLQSALLTAGTPSDVGTQLVQTIAQVVVTKAQQAGWQLLLARLNAAGHCRDKVSRFPNTCQLLANLNIKDLVSSPSALLGAFVSDLLAQVGAANKPMNDLMATEAPTMGAVVSMADAQWLQKAPAVKTGAKRVIDELVAKNDQTICSPATPAVKQYAVVLGLCLIASPTDLSKCDSSKQFASYPGADPATAKRLWDLTVSATSTSSPTDWIDLVFAVAENEVKEIAQTFWDAHTDISKDLVLSYLTSLHDLLAGVTSSDWVDATAGGVSLLNAISVSLKDTNDKQAAQDAAKLIGILAAVGNYALTYDPSKKLDAAAAAAAREKTVTDLVNRMVNRTERDPGVVVSLGGNLGVIGGAKLGTNGSGKINYAFAFPVQLGLGVGLQTYGSKDTSSGFHAQFSVLDLGEYVNFDGQNLKVSSPRVESAVEFGLTAGYWFALRETPLYAGLSGAITPFNQAGGRPTYQVGAVLGIYVPLLDFN